MNLKLAEIKKFYIYRNQREQILILLLSVVIVYFFFYIIVFLEIEHTLKDSKAELAEARNKYEQSNVKIKAIQSIPTTGIYKKWKKQEILFNKEQKSYEDLLRKSSDLSWQEIVKKVFDLQKNIVISEIKNYPESIFNFPVSVDTKRSIYQQKMSLSFDSNYFESISYLKRLESALEGVHWDDFSYKVDKYPNSKINIEFSVVYEKK
jgi:hypothetical protein